MKTKRTLFFLAALALLLICCAAQAEAPELYTCGDYQYLLLGDGTAEIMSCSGGAEALEIPSKLDGYTVTAIGDQAFSYCEALAHVTLPDSVGVINGNPFSGCPDLTDIRVSPGHPVLAVVDGVLFSVPDQRLVCYPCAFTAESYSVPQGTVVIGDGAFRGCRNLIGVALPDSVTVIGARAFAGCGSLATAALPDGITVIGRRAFFGCESLTDFTLPAGVVSIGDYAFSACSSLTGIVLPDGVIDIGAFAFADCGSLAAVSIPGSVTQIGEEAFSFCFSLKGVTVPRGSYAEQYCQENSLACVYAKPGGGN